MAFQYGVALRTNKIGQIQTTVATAGANPQLRIYSGAEPADCNTAATGTLLVTIILPTPFLASAAGTASLTGVWPATAASAGGAGTNAGYFRIYDVAGTPVCHVQGNITATGGGGDMTLNNILVATGQTVSVTSFAVTEANA